MKPWTKARIEKTIAKWQKILGLDNWVISLRVENEMDNDDALFEIERHEDADRAVIHVPQEFISGDWEATEKVDDEFIEVAIVHELCHCLYRDIAFIVKHDLQELFGQVAHELTMRNISRHEERMVDQLARSLVKHYGVV